MPEYLNTFFISVIGGLASGLAGLVGLAYTTRYTDNRKLIDSTLSELEQLADQCAKAAGETWSNLGDPNSASSIETVCLLHDLANFSTFVTDRVPTARLRIDPHLINFRRASTGDDFDVLNRAPDQARVAEIRSSAASLKMAFRSVIYARNSIGLPFFGE
ncbi:hypothetical protein QTL95_10305 [Rhizobium sp. S152]|uniref:hypothetical protein n=1 Tax=Rhizobium sp. S152 TaxID=3055038 RepID=UPI0025A95298|nr:hypothetical protein [Rhizobium sp. S152]MDM9626290.1 hypothetical protein [Rhizobium sp. S152]